jgi:ribosomal protein S18 acetylase RimI-like enzyme
MLIYKNCSETELDRIYEAFKIGFSDYIIKLEMSKEDFIKRFFGPEGNSLDYSFIAMDDDRPVGVILGGLKIYEGIKTLRCGTLCINPQYRGKGISKELFELHKLIALNNSCKQLFLEVIVGNDRAIKFYEGLGYEKVYDIKYYSCKDTKMLEREFNTSVSIEKVNFETISSLSFILQDVHINWQNNFDYMSKLKDLSHYGAYEEGRLTAALSISPKGRIFFIWTNPRCRHKGIAKSLIKEAVKNLSLNFLSISFPNNSSLEGFVKHNGFQKDSVSQYEMYLTL